MAHPGWARSHVGRRGASLDAWAPGLTCRWLRRGPSFLAQVMPWTDRDLESLYLYGRALLPLLPTEPREPLPPDQRVPAAPPICAPKPGVRKRSCP